MHLNLVQISLPPIFCLTIRRSLHFIIVQREVMFSLRTGSLNSQMSRAKKCINGLYHVQRLPEFGASGYGFIYYPSNTKAKRLFAHSESQHFLGLEAYQRLIKVYIPITNKIRHLRRSGRNWRPRNTQGTFILFRTYDRDC